MTTTEQLFTALSNFLKDQGYQTDQFIDKCILINNKVWIINNRDSIALSIIYYYIDPMTMNYAPGTRILPLHSFDPAHLLTILNSLLQ